MKSEKTLDELIKDGQWDIVRDFYEAHPEEIRHVNPSNGSTVLHAICFISSVPVSLLDFVVTAWPEAVTVQENRYGATPLHLLCWTNQRSTKKVNILLERMKPEDLMIRNQNAGSTVLHSACGSHADISVIKAIVRKYPPILLAKTFDHHHTAVNALWQSHLQSIPAHLTIARILKGEKVTEPLFTRFWNKMEFLAMESFRISSSCPKNLDNIDDEELSNYILHGLFDLKSPLNAIKVAIKLNPKLASYADIEGNYSLHHAVIRRPFRVKDKDLIQDLMEANSAAATKRNNDGDAPIHIGIRDRMVWEEGLSNLVEADSDDVLGLPEQNTGLYPFLQCASLGGNVAINNTFCLLIAKPDLVKGACI
jgi:hypothetical protein